MKTKNKQKKQETDFVEDIICLSGIFEMAFRLNKNLVIEFSFEKKQQKDLKAQL